MDNEDQIRIMIYNRTSPIILPVLPESIEITDSWSNQELNINKLGLINMIGTRGLRSLTVSSFLPSKKYEFETPQGTTGNYNPWKVIETLLEWRGMILTLFVAGTTVTWPCVIDGDFTYGEKDGSGDVYYTITFKEYKQTAARRVNNKKKASGSGRTKVKTYTTKKGDTLKKIAKAKMGSASKASKIYQKNKRKVDKATTKYVKKLPEKDRIGYIRKSIYNKPLPAGLKLTIPPEHSVIDIKSITTHV